MIKCYEVYTEDIIFANTDKTIIHAIATAIGEDVINDDLKDILVENKVSIEYDYLLNRQEKILSPLFERILLYNSSEEDHLQKVSAKLANIFVTKFLKGGPN